MNNKVTFDNSEDPITEKEILKFEKKFKVKLPQDYKDFLLKYNGGIPNLITFINKKRKRFNPLKIKRETECSIGKFFSLEDVRLGKGVSIETEELPESVFPVGYDYGDNYICISLMGEDKGCLYYASSYEPHDNYENMYHLADSFTEFLNGLVPFDE